MSELSAFDELMVRTVANAGQQRDQAITEAARMAEESDARTISRISRTGNLECQLAEEITDISERMEWLVDHPYRSRFVGKSAVQLLLQRDGSIGQQVRTPIILEVDKAVEDVHVLTAGYVFWIYRHSNESWKDLYIDRAVSDATTGHEERSRAYRMYPFETEDGPHVDVSGGDFDDFRIARTRELIGKYAAEHPWMSAFTISDGEWRMGRWHRGVYCDDAKLDKDMEKVDPKLKGVGCLLEPGYRGDIVSKLLPQLEQGAGWNYPDLMFADPLDLVRAAHNAIGRRK